MKKLGAELALDKSEVVLSKDKLHIIADSQEKVKWSS